jgi:serine/threonine protein kinase
MAEYYSVKLGYNTFYIDRRYTNLKEIGDGSYGIVASALDNSTGRMVAIKKIKNCFADLVDAKRILRELKLLRHFNSHENIITILDIMTYPPDRLDFDDIYIVTNLMESDLERIIRSKQALTDQHFQYFLYQILRALKYIHSGNVLHRDLKPSNLLVNSNCDLAVCDFGLARGFQSEGKDTLTEYVVTRWYRAPELLCEAPHYGRAVDIWGVGCIFAELLVHEAFFQGSNPQHQLEAIVSKIGCPSRDKLNFVQSQAALQRILMYEGRRPPDFASFFPRNANPNAIDLLQRMLAFHPDDRITVQQALQHPYLAAFHGQMAEPTCGQTFDFDFEREDGADIALSKVEVQALMYADMLSFRQGDPHAIAALRALKIRGLSMDGEDRSRSHEAVSTGAGFKMELDDDGFEDAREMHVAESKSDGMGGGFMSGGFKGEK